MKHVLLACRNQKDKEALQRFLESYGTGDITAVASAGEARRLLALHEYDLVLVDAPLSDEPGYDLAVTAAVTTAAAVLLLTRADVADEISARVENQGVMVLGKPLTRPLLFQAMKMLATVSMRLSCLQHENLKLQGKIEEIRMIDRAKCLLIQYCGMTEPEAHRHLERSAMDRRVTRKEIAQEILAKYQH